MTATPSPTIHFSPRAQAFLQANEDALRQLVTFVDFAAEKFTLGFVSVNFPEDRATIVEALEQHPDCQEIQFVRFKFDDPDLRFLRDELIRELPDIEQDPNRKLVILLTGLEASIGMVGDYPPVLQDLNYVRDGFAASVPYPIVVFLPDKSLSRLAEFAPDFWAWRMAVIRFKSSAETVKSRLNQVIQANGKSELVEAREHRSKFLDSQAKRDMIPRLLMEYEFGSLSDDPEFKAFKADLMAELGVSLYDNDDLDVAKDLLLQVIAAGDSARSIVSKPKAYCYLGIIESRQDNYEQAVDLLSQAILRFEGLEENQSYFDVKDDLKQAIARRGFTYCLMRVYSKALIDLNHAIEIAPDYYWAIASRGETYRMLRCYPEALADFNRAIELDPTYQLAIASRGETYRMLERYPEALADFNRAIELDPAYQGAISGRGETYRMLERYPEALADFNRAIELDPAYQFAISGRGETYRMLERYPEALADFNRAIELDPDDQLAVAQRGQTYYLKHEYERALEDFDQAFVLDSKNAWIIGKRGEMHLLLGNYQQALEYFNHSLQLEADNDDWTIYERSLTYRALGKVENAQADIDLAINLAQKDYEADPQGCQNIFNLALYYLIDDNIDQAKLFYQIGLTNNSSTRLVKEAIRDLEDLLTVLPNYPNADMLRQHLQSALKDLHQSSH